MKLLYVANARIPTEKAHGIQIMEMCRAFSNEGVEVELVVPKRKNPITEDAFSFYGIKKNFSITYLPTIDLVYLGRFGFLFQALTFGLSVRSYIKDEKNKNTTIYGRDELPLFLASGISSRVFWEAHDGRVNIVVRRLLRKLKGVVAISQGVKKFYEELGMHKSWIHVAPDGVDVKQFNVAATKEECRRKLMLPTDKRAVVYTGHLYDWKGADTLARATRFLTDDDVVVFIGGTDKDVVLFKEKYGDSKRIVILGRRPHADIPLYLRAADVLALPNSGKYKISTHYTSPLKLFEYMASGTPIVASDLPSIREILDENMSVFVGADDPKSLAEGLLETLDRVSAGEAFGQYDMDPYSWTNRARDILEYMLKMQDGK